MKLTPAILVLAVAAGPALAQTKAAGKPAVHRTTGATSARTSSCGTDPLPVLASSIPKLAIPTACPKSLYAMRFIDTTVGTGAPAVPRKWLTVNYTGYLTDGTKFDTSVGVDKDGKPKEPITFPYGAHQVITGWDTGFEGMLVGGKRRMFIPYQLAYGEMGRPPVIPAKATLIFDVELVAVSDNPPKPPAPPTPPAGSAPAKPTTTQPAPASPPPGSTPTPAPSDPAKPATVPPPADPTKPTAVPPATGATTPKP